MLQTLTSLTAFFWIIFIAGSAESYGFVAMRKSVITSVSSKHHSNCADYRYSPSQRLAETRLFMAVPPQPLPPINTEVNSNNINSVKDYFIPTSSEEAARRALENYATSKEAGKGEEMIQSSEFIQIDSAMPGAKGSKEIPRNEAFLPTPTYTKEINKREILWISQQFDIYLRRLPQAAFIYALLDFFVLPTSRAVISDELEEEGGRADVAKAWAGRAVFRLGVFSAIVASTSVFENLFYHPF